MKLFAGKKNDKSKTYPDLKSFRWQIIGVAAITVISAGCNGTSGPVKEETSPASRQQAGVGNTNIPASTIDSDGDGIADLNDKCPDDPEDFDGYMDKDGCPDLDNDGDGIADADDACPNSRGPANKTDHSQNGCPVRHFRTAGVPVRRPHNP
ncbi:MAG: hypothetical protein JXR95_02195 [Deltaproteobacteria bacterium]|nr:hypothetical protein [Deltaproteobacteria bacterium]